MTIRPGLTAYAASRVILIVLLLIVLDFFQRVYAEKHPKNMLLLKFSGLRVILTGGYLWMSCRSFLVLS